MLLALVRHHNPAWPGTPGDRDTALTDNAALFRGGGMAPKGKQENRSNTACCENRNVPRPVAKLGSAPRVQTSPY